MKYAREALLGRHLADDRALAALGSGQAQRKRHGGFADAALPGDDHQALVQEVPQPVDPFTASRIAPCLSGRKPPGACE